MVEQKEPEGGVPVVDGRGTDRSILVAGAVLALVGLVALLVATVVGDGSARTVAPALTDPTGPGAVVSTSVSAIPVSTSQPEPTGPVTTTGSSDPAAPTTPPPASSSEVAAGVDGASTVATVAIVPPSTTTNTVAATVPIDTTPLETFPAVASTQAPPPPENAVSPGTCEQVHYIVVGDVAALSDHNGGWDDWCVPIAVFAAISPRIVVDAGLTINDACQLARAGEEIREVSAPATPVDC